MKLFEKDSRWGVTDDNNVLVPPVYENPNDAISEWKWFEVENCNSEPHRKFLPKNKSIEEINQIEKELIESYEKN